MSLIPYDPFRQLDKMRRELERSFSSFGAPGIDIHETKNDVIVKCHLPGFENNEDIQIDVQDQMLTIRGKTNQMYEVKGKELYRREQFAGQFQRSLALPSPVDPNQMKTSWINGMLEIRLPKV